MTASTIVARLAAPALAAALLAGPALAQAPAGIPNVPGMPNVQSEIDRAMQQVPPDMRRRMEAGHGAARIPGLPAAENPASRGAAAIAFTNRVPHKALVVQFAPTGSDSWGRNRLQNERMNTGATMRWRVADSTCHYDVRITFEEGNEFVRLGHDFCAQETIELIEIAADAPAPREGVALYRIVNRSSATIFALRVTPAGNRRQGADLLDQWVMMQGDHYTGRIARSRQCLFDVTAEFTVDGKQRRTLARQNLCNGNEIVVSAGGQS
ncbi:hypothetical protein [Phreatobacter sp.]|uniref:hypothetical protein n=1 Tax=Phreatobacter sp. TaxID=1966341 RepID=UPI003F6FF6D0